MGKFYIETDGTLESRELLRNIYFLHNTNKGNSLAFNPSSIGLYFDNGYLGSIPFNSKVSESFIKCSSLDEFSNKVISYNK